MRRLLMAICFVASAVAVVLASGCGSDSGPTGGTSPNTKQAEKDKQR